MSNDNSDASEAYKAQWQVKLDLSAFKNGDILKDLKITDTLPDGMTFYDVDESEMNFALTLSDDTPLSEGTDYKKEVTNNKTLLTLTFTEEGQRKCAGKDVYKRQPLMETATVRDVFFWMQAIRRISLTGTP